MAELSYVHADFPPSYNEIFPSRNAQNIPLQELKGTDSKDKYGSNSHSQPEDISREETEDSESVATASEGNVTQTETSSSGHPETTTASKFLKKIESRR